jgi:hypothetical protein
MLHSPLPIDLINLFPHVLLIYVILVPAFCSASSLASARSIRVSGLAVLFLVFRHARAAAAAGGMRDQDHRPSCWSTCSPKTTTHHCWPSVPRHRRCREVQLKLERLHRRFSPWRRSCSTSSLADSRKMVSYCRCFESDLLG